jgi:hypothetical protein
MLNWVHLVSRSNLERGWGEGTGGGPWHGCGGLAFGWPPAPRSMVMAVCPQKGGLVSPVPTTASHCHCVGLLGGMWWAQPLSSFLERLSEDSMGQGDPMAPIPLGKWTS